MTNTYPAAIIDTADISELDEVRTMALAIWPSAYSAILSPDQIRYMLEKMYSSDALRNDAASGVIFLIARLDQRAVGFAGYSFEEDSSVCKVHKLYVLPGIQGKGLGKQLLDHIANEASRKQARTLQLNVNRLNTAKHFYEKQGFAVIREQDIDIGENYYMNDFVMAKAL